MRCIQHFKKYDLSPLFSMFLVCLFPCVFICTQNAEEADLSGALTFLGIYLACALVLAIISLPFFRNFSRAAVFSDAVMLIVINYTMIADGLQKKLNWLQDWHLLLLFGIVLLAFFLLLLKKKPDLRTACLLIAIAFGAVTLMNLIMAIPTFYARTHVPESNPNPGIETAITLEDSIHTETIDSATDSTKTENNTSSDDTPSSTEGTATRVPLHDDPAYGIADFTAADKPNVYWFIFDEYGGYENLMHYFDYDNSPFMNALADKGFNISWESKNTEAVYTYILMANMINMDYVMDVEDSSSLSDVYMDNSYVVRMFLENGYQVNLADHLDFIGHTGCNVLTTNQSEKSVSDLLLGNSIFSRFDKVRGDLDDRFDIDSDADYYDQTGNVLQAELDSWQYAQNSPTLTIGYLQSPHSPLVLGSNGEPNDRKQYYNWNDDNNYLTQLEYISDFILELTDTIMEHDPDALIIIQSDHGCRYPIHQIQMGKTDRCDPETEYPHMENILNCVYYRGESIDIEGETAINTLRKTFNHVLGTNFGYLEPIYTWLDISERITPFH